MIDDLLDSFEAAWTGRVRAAFAGPCAPDVHYEDPFCARPLRGTDELGDHAARLWTAFPDAQVRRSGRRLHDGRFVAAPCRLEGTHRGDLPGLPATGRAVVLQAVAYCELDPGGTRLWRVRTFVDGYEAGAQLGLLPRRGGLGERALMLLRGFGLRA